MRFMAPTLQALQDGHRTASAIGCTFLTGGPDHIRRTRIADNRLRRLEGLGMVERITYDVEGNERIPLRPMHWRITPDGERLLERTPSRMTAA